MVSEAGLFKKRNPSENVSSRTRFRGHTRGEVRKRKGVYERIGSWGKEVELRCGAIKKIG